VRQSTAAQMEEGLKSQLRKKLTVLLGPRRFHRGGRRGGRERLGTPLPRSPAEVQQILLLTRDAKVPIFPRAAQDLLALPRRLAARAMPLAWFTRRRQQPFSARNGSRPWPTSGES
jgi:hypothetical protein